VIYSIVRLLIKAALFLYFKEIKTYGLENIPKNKAVLFLPNHQNALLDALLVATRCQRRSWYLTRSDVFKNSVVKSFLGALQMIPIYRIRDGRASLKHNEAVFEQCADLLLKKEALVLFPEANHNLKRRVRKLSKGFTRILFKALYKSPELDLLLIPVGMNYQEALKFPDRVALYFGSPIAVKDLYDANDEKESVERMKQMVSTGLKNLTTHIEDAQNYDKTIERLDALGVDYLNPIEVNRTLQNLTPPKSIAKKSVGFMSRIATVVFTILNFPILVLWRSMVKLKVPEPEFMGTFRFGYSIISFPLYFLLLFFVATSLVSINFGVVLAVIIFCYNLFWVKFFRA